MIGVESEGCTMLTITEVSRTHDVSARMLRYYEQQGLIASKRREGYAYRVYDDENIARLRLILVLRKLRVPLKTIEELRDTAYAIAGVPEPVEFGDRVVGIIEARDGTIMDVVREIKK